MRPSILVVALAAALPVPAAAEVTSVYTPLDLDRCEVVDAAPLDEPGAWSRLRCEGLPGAPVLVAEDDGRMSLDFGPVKAPGRWESFAAFHRVHDVVEWRVEDGAPFATIHRWFVSGDGPERQVLVVSTVASEAAPVSCVAGLVDAVGGAAANERAREVADTLARGFRCGIDEAGFVGPVDGDAPVFVAAAAEPEPAEAAIPGTPEALVRDYWSAAGAAAGPDDLARFRRDGAPPPSLFAHVTELASHYRVASVQPLVASDGERRLAVVLRPRDGEAVSPRSAEVGVVREGDVWRIVTEAW